MLMNNITFVDTAKNVVYNNITDMDTEEMDTNMRVQNNTPLMDTEEMV